MPTIYKIDYPNADKPLAQEVEKVGYPNPDADGETQYENTHFSSLEKAWNSLVSELEAGVSLSTREIVRRRQQLLEAEKKLADDAVLLLSAKDGREKYLLSLSTPA